jgi:hypothetical protein
MQQPDQAPIGQLISAYQCAIDTCNWTYEVPQLGAGLDDDPVAAFEQQALAIEHAVREHCENHDVEDWLRTVMGLREQLAAATPGLACFGCIVDRRNAQVQGVPLEQLPAIGVAEFVVEGRSLGMCHLKMTDAPVIPGRSASGLIVPGVGG